MSANDKTRKITDLKVATKNLRKAQEDLRFARSQYNKAVSALVDQE
jgi:hypothetical protein